MRRWEVVLTTEAEAQLDALADQRIRNSIIEAVNRLEHEPDKLGKPMTGELAGYRSLRAVGQRYRILYKVKAEVVEVLVVTLGIRKEGDKGDIYELAQRLLRLGVLDKELAVIAVEAFDPDNEAALIRGKVTCPECGRSQPISITREEFEAENRFARRCKACKKELKSRFSRIEYEMHLARLPALEENDTNSADEVSEE